MKTAQQLKQTGHNLDGIIGCCEHALNGLMGIKTKEADAVRNHIDQLRKDCEKQRWVIYE